MGVLDCHISNNVAFLHRSAIILYKKCVSMDAIKIYWDSLDTVEVCRPEELIFFNQHDVLVHKMRKVAEKNKRLMETARKSKARGGEAENGYGMPHCFFIDGTRGSGKSTLMRSVRRSLVAPQSGEPRVRIRSLADVDPTELGKEENFFMYILGRIFQRIDGAYMKGAADDESLELQRKAMGALRSMSDGISMLTGAENALQQAQMDDFFLESVIDKCANSTLLREKLDALLELVCKILQTDVLLVTVDDADLNFSKCEDVMEYIRKYMQSSRLLFLFAGDMKLYSHIVRGMYMKSYEQRLLMYDDSHKASRNRLLDQLEEQYLIKMFPLVNRVGVGSADTLLNSPRPVYLWQNREAEKKSKENTGADGLPQSLPLLRRVLNEYLERMAPERRAQYALVTLLGRIPMRSALFLLHDWCDSTPGLTKGSAEYMLALAEGVQKTAEQALVKQNIDYMSLRHADVKELLQAVFTHMSETKGAWNADVALVPSSVDTEKALVTWYLGLVTQVVTAPLYAKLEYFCTLFPHWNWVGGRFKTERTGQDEAELMRELSQKQVALFMGADDAMVLGAMASACMLPRPAKGTNLARYFGNGTIRLMKDPQHWNIQSGRVERSSFAAMVQELRREEHRRKKDSALFCLGIYHSLCRLVNEQETYFCFSVYNLIGYAVELLRMGRENEGDAAALRETVKRSLEGMPDLPLAEIDGAEDSGAEEGEVEVRHLPVPEFASAAVEDEICAWIEKFGHSADTLLSPSLMQDCWNGYLSRCEKYTEEYVLRSDKMEKFPCALTLLNAFMMAFEDAAMRAFGNASSGNHSVSECISSFPLWRALRSAEKKMPKLYDAVNNVNIGALSHQKLVNAYKQLEKELKTAAEERMAAMKDMERSLPEIARASRDRTDEHRKLKACQEAAQKARSGKEKLAQAVQVSDTAIKQLRAAMKEISASSAKGEKDKALLVLGQAACLHDRTQADAALSQYRDLLAQKKVAMRSTDKKEAEAIQRLKHDMEKLQSDIHDKVAHIKELENQMKATSAQIREVSKSLKKLQTELSGKEAAEQKAKANLDKAKAELARAEEGLVVAERAEQAAELSYHDAAKYEHECRVRRDEKYRMLRDKEKQLAVAQKEFDRAQMNDAALIKSILAS